MTEAARPNFIVITGLSGSGKSQAVKVFEDLGYYTLDSMPPALMGTALDVCRKGGHPRVAFVIDSRSGQLFRDAPQALGALVAAGEAPHLLYFDASDEVLLQRYSETRHRHPLEESGGVEPSIVVERELLTALRSRAAKVIDTTYLTVRDLRDTLHSLYGSGASAMFVQVSSFGYRHGLPPAADLVFDVRFMENPFYVPELRDLTGTDPQVRDFVLKHPATKEFLSQVDGFLRFALPRYEAERKARLGLAFGCTGGRHRSVVIADEMASRLAAFWPGEIAVAHRDRGRIDPGT